jgi:hypothetical protein
MSKINGVVQVRTSAKSIYRPSDYRQGADGAMTVRFDVDKRIEYIYKQNVSMHERKRGKELTAREKKALHKAISASIRATYGSDNV